MRRYPRFQRRRRRGILLSCVAFLLLFEVFTLLRDRLERSRPGADLEPVATGTGDGGEDGKRTAGDSFHSVRGELDVVNCTRALRFACERRVALLERVSWRNLTHLSAPNPGAGVRYRVIGVPVCLQGGVLHVDQSREEMAIDEDDSTMRMAPLDETVFEKALSWKKEVVAVPAVGLLVGDAWAATHAFHLIHDILEGLYVLLRDYNNGEWWDVPTQTVLMYTPQERWPGGDRDVYGRMQLSAEVLNAFSSPRGGGPFFASSLIVNVSGRVRDSQTLCFCQALLVSRTAPSALSAELYYGIQDLTAAQFRAAPYYAHEDMRTAERERVSALHWSPPSWPSQLETLKGPISPPENGTRHYHPRALFIHRHGRVIRDVGVFTDMLRSSGFHVAEVFPEHLPVAQQHHLGRYADMVVGMHGLGLIHGFWMNRYPRGCRVVLEFRPWSYHGASAQFQRMFGQHMGFFYRALFPLQVSFGARVSDSEGERRRLMDPSNVVRAFTFPGFRDQVAEYNRSAVEAAVKEALAHLMACLPPDVKSE